MPKDRLVQSNIQFFSANKMVWQWDGRDWDGAPKNKSRRRLLGFTDNPARVLSEGKNGQTIEVDATSIGLTVGAILRLQVKLGMNQNNGASHQDAVDPRTDPRFRTSVKPGFY